MDGASDTLFVDGRPVLTAHPPDRRRRAFWVSFSPADTQQQQQHHEVRFCPPARQIVVDGVARSMRYDLPAPCVEMDAGRLHGVRFEHKSPRSVQIDGVNYLLNFGDDRSCRVKFGRTDSHLLSWGGPGFELIVNGRPHELQFGARPRIIYFGRHARAVSVKEPAPPIRVLGELRFDPAECPPPPPPPQTPRPAPLLPSPEHPLKRLAHFDRDAVALLFQGMQCHQCGRRFNFATQEQSAFAVEDAISERNRKLYRRHLDFHFAKNKQKRDVTFRCLQPHRSFFAQKQHWLMATSEDDDAAAASTTKSFATKAGDDDDDQMANRKRRADTGGENEKKPRPDQMVSCVVATGGDIEKCQVCNEDFEQMYMNEFEEWRYMNAVRNEFGVFHTQCVQDHRGDDDGGEEEEEEEPGEQEGEEETIVALVTQEEIDEIGDIFETTHVKQEEEEEEEEQATAEPESATTLEVEDEVDETANGQNE